MNANIVLAVTVAEALQSLVESIQVLEESVVPHKRKQFMDSLSRVRRARTEIQAWVEDQR
jgi:hypothetical protein